MPDFDVQVIGLSSPLAAAPVTTYTPAVSVRNNGLSAVTVTGVVRRYQSVAPGELLQTIQLTPKSIAAGATSDVLCSQTWTPTTGEIGTSYIFTADVVAKDDQVEENNHLSPTVITVVTGAPPPPPPVVTTHAAQHEQGGTDVLNVAGLAGELQDEQPAKDHAGKHEQGGADEITVDGLQGTLATPQPTASHGNEKHITPFASVAQLAAHDAAATAHASSTNLEKITSKGAANGYAGLDSNGLLTYSQLPTPASAGVSLNRAQILAQVNLDSANETTIVELQAAPAPTSGDTHEIEVSAIVSSAGPNTLKLKVYAAETSGDLEVIASTSLDIAPGTTGQQVFMRCIVSQLGTYNRANGFVIDAMLGPVARMSLLATTYKLVTEAQYFKVTAQLTSGATTTSAYFYLATIRKTAAST